MDIAIKEKIEFFKTVLEEFNTLTLIDQFRLLFIKGAEFGKRHPKFAALAEQFSKEKNESVKLAIINEGNKQSESLFLQIIEKAKSKGEIDNSIDSLALSMLLQSLYGAVNEYMLSNYEGEVHKFVDSLLGIVFNGIHNKN